jgi:tRNA A-37 threonylcarbamoyl transferase component Bud32
MSIDPPRDAPPRSGAPYESALIGSVIAGKYRLLRVVGHGGMGTVFKAENTAIGRTVALKLLHRSLADDSIVLQRFEREARITVSVGHPHIVEVLDMGRERGGAPFLVMEYVRGRSLKQVLSEQGPFSVPRAARIVGQVLDALHAAHTRGVVHRDLKPENVLLTARHGDTDFVKVFDFGISTFIESAAEREHALDLTPTGYTMATPFYASPEQLRGDKGRDPRVDVYAMGVMLYELLAGHRPYEARSLAELCTRILGGEPAPLRVFRRDIPPELEAVVLRALDRDLAHRYPSAYAFHAALVRFGALPLRADEPEPTDTFTYDLRQIAGRAGQHDGPAELPARGRDEGVRAEVVRALLDGFEQRHGAARIAQTLKRLPASERQEVAAALDTGAAIGAHALARALELLDDTLGDGGRAEVAQAGRYFARVRHTEALMTGGKPAATPELYFAHAVDLWNQYFGYGQAQVQNLGRGYGRLEITSQAAPELVLSVAMLGCIDEGLRLSGGKSVGVRLVGSAAAGDDRDTFEASWAG